MPADKNPAPPMMLCLMGYTTAEGVYPTGDRRRADDPAVKARPIYWIAEDSSDNDRRAAYLVRFPGAPILR